jgi:hypothetical protein
MGTRQALRQTRCARNVEQFAALMPAGAVGVLTPGVGLASSVMGRAARVSAAVKSQPLKWIMGRTRC